MTVVKHPTDVLQREIARVDAGLERPVTVYLIGGGAIGLKDATKDIDTWPICIIRVALAASAYDRRVMARYDS